MTRPTTVIENLPPEASGRALGPPPRPSGDDACFEAVLYPNRSLPNVGFLIVMSVVVGANLVFGVMFFSMGAWPVIGFCGLDVFLVWLAFRLSYRQGRLHEWVRVTPDALLVSRVLPSGHESRWRLHPFWTEVRIDHRDAHEAQLRLVSNGRSLVLGGFLAPRERAEFGDRLAQEIGRLRSPDGARP